MKILKPICLTILLSALILSSCNLPEPMPQVENTSEKALVSVSSVSIYRSGPGETYDLIGSLNPCQRVEMEGISTDSDYPL